MFSIKKSTVKTLACYCMLLTAPWSCVVGATPSSPHGNNKNLRSATRVLEDQELVCPQSENCAEEGGICVRECDDSNPGVLYCLEHICEDEDCICQVMEETPSPTPPSADCTQSTKCVSNGGKCVRDCPIGSTTIECVPEFCEGPDCLCQIEPNQAPIPTPPPTPFPTPAPTPVPTTPPLCTTNDDCANLGTGGRCVQDCVEISGVVACDKSVCPKEECACKHCVQLDDACTSLGGKCIDENICQEMANEYARCDPNLCGNNESGCACMLPTPCPTTDKCRAVGGVCMFDCEESDMVGCGDECLGAADDGCLCAQCLYQSSDCLKVGGICTPYCVAGPGQVCEASLCTPDFVDSPCACLYTP